jgi:hypothetical protein
MSGCPIRVLKKIYNSWDDLNKRGVVGESMFISDDEFRRVISNAEKAYGLTDKDQYHELFWNDCKRLLGDKISETASERRERLPVWARM